MSRAVFICCRASCPSDAPLGERLAPAGSRIRTEKRAWRSRCRCRRVQRQDLAHRRRNHPQRGLARNRAVDAGGQGYDPLRGGHGRPEGDDQALGFSHHLILREGTRLREYECEENNLDRARYQELLKNESLFRRK
jgi:hypothetical protein